MKWRREKVTPSLPPWIDDETVMFVFALIFYCCLLFVGLGIAVLTAIVWVLIG